MSKIQHKLALFIENHNALKKGRLSGYVGRRLIAFVFALNNYGVDCNILRNKYDIARPVASFPHGEVMVTPLSAIKTNNSDADFLTLIGKINEVYEKMVKAGFLYDSHYISLASYFVATMTGSSNYDNAVARAREFYTEAIGSRGIDMYEEDFPLVALFGVSDMDINYTQEQVVQQWQFYSANLEKELMNAAMQLALTLVFNSSVDPNHAVALGSELIKITNRERMLQWTRIGAFPALGILAQLPVDIGTLIGEISHTQNLLWQQKGFSKMRVPNYEVQITAALIVASVYLDNMKQTPGICPSYLVHLENMIINVQYTFLRGMSERLNQNWLYSRGRRQ